MLAITRVFLGKEINETPFLLAKLCNTAFDLEEIFSNSCYGDFQSLLDRCFQWVLELFVVVEVRDPQFVVVVENSLDLVAGSQLNLCWGAGGGVSGVCKKGARQRGERLTVSSSSLSSSI